MKTFKYVLTFILFIFVGLIIFFYCINYLETPKSKFSSYQELEQSVLIEKGWVPPFLPKSATKIREQHSLDLNWTEMEFTYDPNDTEYTMTECNNIKRMENGVECNCVYEGQSISITLFKNGKGLMFSK